MSVVTDETKDIAYIYSYDNTNQIVMNIEAALARAQASQGIIPEWAAEEITKKAEVRYMPKTEVDAENEFVRHRLVSRLNVWKKDLWKMELKNICIMEQQQLIFLILF